MTKKTTGCEARKVDGTVCCHPQGGAYQVIVEGLTRFLCGVHHSMFEAGKPVEFIERVVQGTILADTLEPNEATPPQLPTAVKVAGKKGVNKSKIVKAITALFAMGIHHVKLVNPRILTGDEFFIVGTGASRLQDNWGKMHQVKDICVAQLERAKAAHGDNLVVVSGGSRGFDYALARAALEAGVRLWVVLPSTGYICFYWGGDRARIDNACVQAEAVIYVNETYVGRNRKPGASNFDRNEAMVSLAAQNGSLWVYNKRSRGTSHAFGKAQSMGISKVWELPLV